VLLCTDVAARGLDFPAVTCIIQYDAAGEPSEYVHRVGRTARMGHKGEALLFMLPSERGYISLLESQSVALTQLQLPALCRCLPDVQAASMMGKAAAKKMRRAPAGAPGEEEACGEYAGAAAMLQRALVRTVGADPELKQQAQAAFR
jgi:ATP-dependent RNA helicase DDX31/DBP7